MSYLLALHRVFCFVATIREFTTRVIVCAGDIYYLLSCTNEILASNILSNKSYKSITPYLESQNKPINRRGRLDKSTRRVLPKQTGTCAAHTISIQFLLRNGYICNVLQERFYNQWR